mmetsp:Transcript_5818/g.12937  ORF Transcript_5818/g.12937 Transcript_5818/m.12937 type:complete len:182 (+) Transcript_5818:1465-2010(+)
MVAASVIEPEVNLTSGVNNTTATASMLPDKAPATATMEIAPSPATAPPPPPPPSSTPITTGVTTTTTVTHVPAPAHGGMGGLGRYVQIQMDAHLDVFSHSRVVSFFWVDRLPVSMTCPYCQQTMVTRTRDLVDGVTIIAVIALLCCFWPLFWLPFCIPACKATEHYCTRCNRRIATVGACT